MICCIICSPTRKEVPWHNSIFVSFVYVTESNSKFSQEEKRETQPICFVFASGACHSDSFGLWRLPCYSHTAPGNGSSSHSSRYGSSSYPGSNRSPNRSSNSMRTGIPRLGPDHCRCWPQNHDSRI